MQIRNFEQEANACKNIIEILQNQLAEKDAMIDRLCCQLADDSIFTPEEWLKMAQEAVKKND